MAELFVVIKEKYVNGAWRAIEVHAPATCVKAMDSQLDEHQIAVMKLQGFISMSIANAFIYGMLMGEEDVIAGTLRARIT